VYIIFLPYSPSYILFHWYQPLDSTCLPSCSVFVKKHCVSLWHFQVYIYIYIL
jgi:hypothetical protein